MLQKLLQMSANVCFNYMLQIHPPITALSNVCMYLETLSQTARATNNKLYLQHVSMHLQPICQCISVYRT